MDEHEELPADADEREGSIGDGDTSGSGAEAGTDDRRDADSGTGDAGVGDRDSGAGETGEAGAADAGAGDAETEDAGSGDEGGEDSGSGDGGTGDEGAGGAGTDDAGNDDGGIEDGDTGGGETGEVGAEDADTGERDAGNAGTADGDEGTGDSAGGTDDADSEDRGTEDAGSEADSGAAETEDAGTEDAGTEDADTEDADTEDADTDDADTEDEPPDDAADDPAPVLPPVEPADVDELVEAYHQPAVAGRGTLPWSWATLTPGEREALVTVIDGFVRSYNAIWALTDAHTVPPCWHRHPALAHDLAALAWTYYQAYRDPAASPDRALRFQSHLPRFAERLDRWLGAEPDECRAGRHSRSWRKVPGIARAPRRTSTEDSDAVTLLGDESFGFDAPAPEWPR